MKPELTESDVAQLGDFDHARIEDVDADGVAGRAVLLVQHPDDVNADLARVVGDSGNMFALM